MIAFERETGYPIQIIEINATDGSFPTSLSNNIAFVDEYPTWQPFQKNRSLLGSSGFLGSTASGFLFGRSGGTVTSVLTFDAVTPGTAIINNQNEQASVGSNIIFTIAADSITNISYLNGTDVKPTVLLTGPTTPPTPGAIVDFDANTGKVTDVLPYAAASRAASPIFRREGSLLVYQGRFIGIWDAAGKDLAPQGAAEATFDAGSGRLVGWR